MKLLKLVTVVENVRKSFLFPDAPWALTYIPHEWTTAVHGPILCFHNDNVNEVKYWGLRIRSSWLHLRAHTMELWEVTTQSEFVQVSMLLMPAHHKGYAYKYGQLWTDADMHYFWANQNLRTPMVTCEPPDTSVGVRTARLEQMHWSSDVANN